MASFSNMAKETIQKALNNRFFIKNGLFSKTAVILCATWAFVLFKYLFATCVIDFVVYNIAVHWPIVFNWADAGALTTAASALYFAVHKPGSNGNGSANQESNTK